YVREQGGRKGRPRAFGRCTHGLHDQMQARSVRTQGHWIRRQAAQGRRENELHREVRERAGLSSRIALSRAIRVTGARAFAACNCEAADKKADGGGSGADGVAAAKFVCLTRLRATSSELCRPAHAAGPAGPSAPIPSTSCQNGPGWIAAICSLGWQWSW